MDNFNLGKQLLKGVTGGSGSEGKDKDHGRSMTTSEFLKEAKSFSKTKGKRLITCNESNRNE